MKITKSQLKQIIKEEASRLKKQYILEDKKKAITRELRKLSENETWDKDSSHRDTTSDTSYQDNWDDNPDMDMGDDDLTPEELAKFNAANTAEGVKAAFNRALNYKGDIMATPEGPFSFGGNTAKGAAEAFEDESFRNAVLNVYGSNFKHPNFVSNKTVVGDALGVSKKTNNPKVLKALIQIAYGALWQQ
jgi:hypothetical protein